MLATEVLSVTCRKVPLLVIFLDDDILLWCLYSLLVNALTPKNLFCYCAQCTDPDTLEFLWNNELSPSVCIIPALFLLYVCIHPLAVAVQDCHTRHGFRLS